MTETPARPLPPRTPSLAGRLFWALIAFGAVAILAGAAFIRFGPGLPAPLDPGRGAPTAILPVPPPRTVDLPAPAAPPPHSPGPRDHPQPHRSRGPPRPLDSPRPA